MPKEDTSKAPTGATLAMLRELVRCAQHHFDRQSPQVYRWLDEAERALGPLAHEGGGELRTDVFEQGRAPSRVDDEGNATEMRGWLDPHPDVQGGTERGR